MRYVMRYEEVGHIAMNDSDLFLKAVSRRIEEYQNKGYIVEIQYQQQLNTYSALILGYKVD